MDSVFSQQLLDGMISEGHDRGIVHRVRIWTAAYLLESMGFDIDVEYLRLRYPDIPIFGPFKCPVADMFESYPEKTGEVTVANPSEIIRELEVVPSDYDHIFHFADKIGLLSSPQFLCSDPEKFHFADGSGYVQLPRSLLFDPNYKGAADRIQSDSAYKEAIQNTGMSGAGGSKGKGGDPTKDDEVANRRTMAWKLGLSVKAVTPNFFASAKINLEMKSGLGSNSKPPPLPPMPTPLACKLYDCFLGFKKKFID